MPKPMNYPKALFVRIPEDWPGRINTLQREGEQITSVQRRVVQAGLEALEKAALDAAEPAAQPVRAKHGAGRKSAKGEAG